MKRHKKQTRAYSLGGLILVVLLLVFIVLLVVGGISINLDGCEGLPLASVRAAPRKLSIYRRYERFEERRASTPKLIPRTRKTSVSSLYSLRKAQAANCSSMCISPRE